MTSYQNVAESQISGYNDCPVLDFSKKSGSSTSLASRNRRRLLHGSTPTPSSASTISPSPIPSKPLVTRKASASPNTSYFYQQSTKDIPEIDTNELLLKLDNDVLQKPSTLPAIEFSHYSKKLKDTINGDALKNDHKYLIWTSIDRALNNENLKDELVQFMLSNDGVSSWCQPLKKILENVSQI